MAESIATTLLPETENKRRSSYRSIADTSFFSYFLDCVSSDLPTGGLLALHNKAAVEPVNSNQLVMGALLDDLTVIDNKYSVGIAHGFQPMGNHDDGLVMCQLGDGLHQLFFIFRVNIGRGLVQNDDRRVLHNRPGDGNALPLAAGERCTTLTDHSIKAVRQRHDKVIAPRLFCCGLYLLHGGIGLSETDIVGDGVREQIGPLKHKGEIADEAVVAVLPYIPSTEAHAAGLHIPEPRHKIAEGCFATSRGADDGDGGFLRNRQRHILQNGLAVVGKIHMGQSNILPLRRQFLPVNIHGLHIQDGVCLVHADVDGAEQGRKAPGRVQLLEEKEGADQHQKAVCKLHRAAEVKDDGSDADGNAGELVDDELRQHIKNRRYLHGKGSLAGFLHGTVYLRCGIVGQVEILDLGDALHIFQHLGNKPLVGMELPLGKGLLSPLHGGIDSEEQHQSGKRNKPHTPVKEEHHRRDDAGGQEAPRCDHDHPCGNVGHVLHGVGGDGGDLAETVVVEPAHGQIPQMLRNLNPLVGAGAVACTGLEHGGLHVDGNRNDQ